MRGVRPVLADLLAVVVYVTAAVEHATGACFAVSWRSSLWQQTEKDPATELVAGGSDVGVGLDEVQDIVGWPYVECNCLLYRGRKKARGT